MSPRKVNFRQNFFEVNVLTYRAQLLMGSLWIKKFRGYEDFPLPEPAGTTYKDVYKNINEDIHFEKNILKNIKKESIVSISSWPCRK